ncbi:MAG: methyltransferase domain-containing protein [Candidatus Eisenbacteria bacterium]|nr:methyltransferase domain-containing protein [Candidatus Eisenbacteria bacterium]
MAAAALRTARGERILDLGCGQGGPGLWVARETGASLVGVDLSLVGLEGAQETALDFGLVGSARFCLGDMTRIPFKDRCFDGACSFAALFAVEDVTAVFKEAARVLRPGARLVFTNWSRSIAPACYAPPVADYRPMLDASGFEVERHEPVAGAIDRMRRVCELHLKRAERLEGEMGDIVREGVLKSARHYLGLEDGIDYLAASQWVLVAARKL